MLKWVTLLHYSADIHSTITETTTTSFDFSSTEQFLCCDSRLGQAPKSEHWVVHKITSCSEGGSRYCDNVWHRGGIRQLLWRHTYSKSQFEDWRAHKFPSLLQLWVQRSTTPFLDQLMCFSWSCITCTVLLSSQYWLTECARHVTSILHCWRCFAVRQQCTNISLFSWNQSDQWE